MTNADSYQDLVKMLRSSGKVYDLGLIQRAYNMAKKAHTGQKRVSGEPYIIHPVAVACYLADLGMDTWSIVAALLHDVVEDTDVTIETVEKEFGKGIADLVMGLTKLSKINFITKEEQKAENIRKMLLATAKDVRVMIIKLADRVHNMRTMDFMPRQKQLDKSFENMQIYAPIAHRFGMNKIKEELEDISIRYLDPEAVEIINSHLDEFYSNSAELIAAAKKEIFDAVSISIPNVYIEGRVKSIKGIHKKMFEQARGFDDIYDVCALRVIVDSIADCYIVLGVIHEMYTPINSRFKDYISVPKSNGYQSIHTSVINQEGACFEVQIRTWEMHHTAEYGVAAHWKYKEGIADVNKAHEQFEWIRKMLEQQQDAEDATEIIHNIKTELVQDEVFIFTPKGECKCLPLGSTIIDFAYHVHSEVGNRMIGAKVNSKITPIESVLISGSRVEIITTNDPNKGPSRDWLKIVKTGEARSKIRQWFKREKREDNIKEGRAELEREFKSNSIRINEKQLPEFILPIARRHHFETVDDFFSAIGYGGLQVWKLIPRIREDYAKYQRTQEPSQEDDSLSGLSSLVKPEESKRRYSGKSTVVLENGMDNFLVKFAGCCNPLPPDPIIGFVTKGYGISIHRRDCSNVPENTALAEFPDRWVGVSWNRPEREKFNASINILYFDRIGVIKDVSTLLEQMRISIRAFAATPKNNDTGLINLVFEIGSYDHLQNVISRLAKIVGIISVERA